MHTYAMLSAGPGHLPTMLTTLRAYRQYKEEQSFMIADCPHLHKRFQARCWCEAMKIYKAEAQHGDYDMLFCKEDDPVDRCGHFDKVKRLKLA